MTRKTTMRLAAGCAAAMLFSVLAGCSSQGGGTDMNKDEQASFKGGPMPADARATMQKSAPDATNAPQKSGNP